jgi:3-methyl-2-oxobutanoate hydroxymethyltransferase
MGKKLTVQDILEAKGKRKLTQVWVSGHDMAQACEGAGIDWLSVRLNGFEGARAGAPNTFITAANPRGSYNASDSDAIKSGFSLMGAGADAIYMCAAPERIKAVAKEWIPVVGHVGFVPAQATWTGGFRAFGKTAAEAMKIYEATLAHQEAGAFAVEMEVVPHRVAAEIAKRVEICVISLGSGAECDCEYLFGTDILGSYRGHYPRHSKRYRNHYEDSVEAFKEFKQEVEGGEFPEEKNLVEVDEREFEKFMESID